MRNIEIKARVGALLRVPMGGTAELVFYRRDGGPGPQESFYVRSPAPDKSMLSRACFMMCILLAGCGKPSETPPGAATEAGGAADVTITLDGVHHDCVVTLAHEPHGSTIACSDIGAFLKDELRLSSGATYDLRTAPPVSAEELSALKRGLNAAGYRMAGGP